MSTCPWHLTPTNLLLLCLRRLLDRRMRRRQPRDRHAERRAAHVVQSNAVAELNGARVAAVFAADAALEILAGLAAELHGHRNQLADAARVERLERVALQDFLLDVLRQEAARVVAAVAKGHLRQV